METLTIMAPIPVLRIFDEAKAKEFYLDFLGFHLDWEHRFEGNFPLYLQISSGTCVLHLSEHHGDACPGALVRIEVNNIEELQSVLTQKQYKYAKPGIRDTPWGLREMGITDPFGNKLIFFERKG